MLILEKIPPIIYEMISFSEHNVQLLCDLSCQGSNLLQPISLSTASPRHLSHNYVLDPINICIRLTQNNGTSN